jgi:UDP-glucuronate decarboxylase
MTVPAVTEVWRRQPAHSWVHALVASVQARLPPQAGQTKPSGQRMRASQAAQAASSGNWRWKAIKERGTSSMAEPPGSDVRVSFYPTSARLSPPLVPPGRSGISLRRNIEHLVKEPRFELIRHDVTFPLYVEVDLIFNLACPASPIHYQRDPVQTVKTSVHGAINMLGLAKRTQARIFQASTSEVYGDPFEHPQTETYWGNVNPIGPRACYDEGKRCAETLFFDYHRQHGLDVRVARIFNTYGPRMPRHDGRVVSNFVAQAVAGEDITIQGDGSQTRSFCYVDDLVEAILRFMQADGPLPGPINLGNPGEFTIRELAGLVIELTGSRSRIVQRPLPEDDPRQRRPDIARARELLGWQPTVPLREGLERTIAWYRSEIDR